MSWCRPVARGGVRRSVLKVAVVVVFRRSSESSTVEVHPLVITCGSLPSTTDSGTRADQMRYARQRHRLTTLYAALRPLPGQRPCQGRRFPSVAGSNPTSLSRLPAALRSWLN